jgi:hypothetical protein
MPSLGMALSSGVSEIQDIGFTGPAIGAIDSGLGTTVLNFRNNGCAPGGGRAGRCGWPAYT